MKFSFNLIKKITPGKYTKEQLVEKLNLHSFEAVDVGGDILEISVTPNRFSDASSHIGIAREAAVALGLNFKDPVDAVLKFPHKDQGVFRANIKNGKLCRRYVMAYADNVKVGQSPAWLKEALESCGLRSINNVVDIMNYVMLEVGQPLHAFDADKVKGGLIVRNAGKGETIETIDNQKFNLDEEVLIIADSDKPLAIAGIKGGKSSEVSNSTKRLLLESASFESSNIYTTSRRLGLRTDASVRFSHPLSPELAARGMKRALMLLQDLVGAQIHMPADVYPKKQSKEVLPLDIKKINSLIGVEFKQSEVASLLQKLGFTVKGKKVEVPLLRNDIQNIEDLAEEIVRFNGLEHLPSKPPHIALGVATEEDIVVLKDQVRNFLASAGYSEVYNYSLVSESDCNRSPAIIRSRDGKAAQLANPMSAQLAVLRDSLASGLIKNLKENRRFFDQVRIFEIGNVFQDINGSSASSGQRKIEEKTVLGAALAAKDGILEMKGIVEMILARLGATDYSLIPIDNIDGYIKPVEALKIELGGVPIGYLGSLSGMPGALMEIDLGTLIRETSEEKEFTPLAKYPAITRDMSLLVDQSVRVGDILSVIQQVSAKLVEDVDLIDWYQDEKLGDNKKSLTFRIVFRAEDRTLTDTESDLEMSIINKAVADKFDADLR